MLIPFQTLLTKYNLKPTGVFHIGASTGQEAKDYYNAGVYDVIWIEAIPEIFTQLQQHISAYHKMIAYNECIGNKDGFEVKFNVSSHGAQSSSILELGTHKEAHPEVSYVSSFKAKTKRIDTLLHEKNIDLNYYNFLNIDLQGAELMALQGMGVELHKIDFIYIEVNKAELYIGCPLISDIDTYLDRFDFVRVETEWAGNTNWGDAAYIKIRRWEKH